jgi:hypothetical protein
MFRAIFLIAAISASGPVLAQHHGGHREHDHWGHWGGAEYSGRGMQNERHGRHERPGYSGRIHNDRWYGPEWCWTDSGIPFHCD